jgi:hypothetical protein
MIRGESAGTTPQRQSPNSDNPREIDKHARRTGVQQNRLRAIWTLAQTGNRWTGCVDLFRWACGAGRLLAGANLTAGQSGSFGSVDGVRSGYLAENGTHGLRYTQI